MLTPTADGILHRRIHPESVRWSIFAGCALILLGILAIAAPLLAGVALETIIAWLLIFGGISHLFLAWHVRGAGAHTWEILIGLAYLLAGGYLFFHPLSGLVGLTAILGAYLLLIIGTLIGITILFSGISRLALAMAARRTAFA